MKQAPAVHEVYPNDRTADSSSLIAVDAQSVTNAADIVTLNADLAAAQAALALYIEPTLSESVNCLPNQAIPTGVDGPLTVNSGTAQPWITWNPAAGVFAELDEGTYLVGMNIWFRINGTVTSQLLAYIENTSGAAPQPNIYSSSNHSAFSFYTNTATALMRVAAPSAQLRLMARSQAGVTFVSTDTNRIWIVKLE